MGLGFQLGLEFPIIRSTIVGFRVLQYIRPLFLGSHPFWMTNLHINLTMIHIIKLGLDLALNTKKQINTYLFISDFIFF
jgi:hypothetical protein